MFFTYIHPIHQQFICCCLFLVLAVVTVILTMPMVVVAVFVHQSTLQLLYSIYILFLFHEQTQAFVPGHLPVPEALPCVEAKTGVMMRQGGCLLGVYLWGVLGAEARILICLPGFLRMLVSGGGQCELLRREHRHWQLRAGDGN